MVMMTWYSCRLHRHILGVCTGSAPWPAGVSEAHEEETRRKGYPKWVWPGV